MAVREEWPDADIEQLRALWLAGQTCSAIARTLRRSKNAVIGKVHRMRLAGRPSPIDRNGPNPRRPRVRRIKPTAKTSPSMDEQAAVKDQPMPDASVVAVTVVTPPVILAAVARPAVVRHCEWPLWGVSERLTHRYCGGVAMARASRLGPCYCAEHHARAFARRPAAVDVGTPA